MRMQGVHRIVGSHRGIGLIAAVLFLGIVAVATAIAAPMVSQVSTTRKTIQTRDQLEQIRIALAGRRTLQSGTTRSDFGYLGSMGNSPATLSQLWLKESQPDFNLDPVTLVSGGWTGAYVPDAMLEDLLTFDRDAFGNALVYTNTPFNRPADGLAVAVRVMSPGPDGMASSGDDMWVDILQTEVRSDLSGTLVVRGQPVGFATVTLNVPDQGVVGKRYAVTDTNGNYSFTDVPQGFRTLTVDPKLTFQESTVIVNSDRLEFRITNFGSDPITLDSITPTYNAIAYFERVRIGGVTVFNDSVNRMGSSQTVGFAPISIAGTGKASQLVPVTVGSASTHAPPLEIQGQGSTATIIIDRFRNAPNGRARNVSIVGVAFTLHLSEGTVIEIPANPLPQPENDDDDEGADNGDEDNDGNDEDTDADEDDSDDDEDDVDDEDDDDEDDGDGGGRGRGRGRSNG